MKCNIVGRYKLVYGFTVGQLLREEEIEGGSEREGEKGREKKGVVKS